MSEYKNIIIKTIQPNNEIYYNLNCFCDLLRFNANGELIFEDEDIEPLNLQNDIISKFKEEWYYDDVNDINYIDYNKKYHKDIKYLNMEKEFGSLSFYVNKAAIEFMISEINKRDDDHLTMCDWHVLDMLKINYSVYKNKVYDLLNINPQTYFNKNEFKLVEYLNNPMYSYYLYISFTHEASLLKICLNVCEEDKN